MANETIKLETSERVGLIRFDRPDSRHAINSKMLEELTEALSRYDADDAVSAVVITGDDKLFSSGHDIEELREADLPSLLRSDPMADLWATICRSRKPLIAAVAGYAHGGGLELALTCDFIIAAENAKFGFPDTSLGLIPSAGGVQRLTRLVGRAKATDMLLTCRNMDAAEAERSGLASRVVATDDLLDESLKAAGRIAERAPLAVLAAKEAVRAVDETHLIDGMRAERRLVLTLLSSEDAREGMDARIEKRSPQFRGK